MNVSNVGSKSALRASSMVGGLRRKRTFSAPLTTDLFASGKGSTTPTFTRATTAYVTDYEGKLNQVKSGEARFWGAERVENEFQSSENFTSGVTWGKNGTNAGSVYTGFADPFGGTTAAYLVVDNGSSVTGNDNVGSMAQTVTKKQSVATTVSVSFYAKAGEAHVVRLRETTTTGYRAAFNLNTGVVTYENSGSAGNFFSQMHAVGNGWYRCQSVYVTAAGATQGFAIKGCGAGEATTGDGVSGLYVACAQYEDVTLSQVQAANPYVSNGALSAPFHGANVDGVKYFSSVQIHNQNVTRRSEALYDSAYWNNAGTAPTVHALSSELGPFGGETTRIVFANGAVSLRSSSYTTLYARSYRMGAWVKSNTGTNQPFRLNIFDGISSNYSADMIATNEWQFFTHGPFTSLTTTSMTARIANDTTFQPSDILVGGVMFQEASDYLNYTYIPNTGTSYGSAQPTGNYIDIPSSTTLGYLSEPASTNLLQRSEEFDSATWLKTDSTVTANTVPAPNGYAIADSVLEGAAGTASLNQGTGAYTANNVVSYSVYLRTGGTTSWMRLTMTGTGTPADSVRAWFNISTGAKGTVSTAGAATQAASFMEALSGGWYRCTVTFLPNATETTVQTYVSSADGDGSTARLANASYRIWGAQFEVGPSATSYIPTTSATVTRNSDSLTYPGSGNATNATGTAYAEATWIDKMPVASRIVAYSGGAGATPLMLSTAPALQSSDGTVFLGVSGNWTQFQTYKCAVAYGGVTRSLARTGGTQVNDAAYDGDYTTGVTNIGIGVIGTSNQLGGCTRNVKLYSVKVNNTQLANLVA